MKPIRLAIIGCGAIVESAHLPALAQLNTIPVLLVDRDRSRADALAARFSASETADDYRPHLGRFDAALVAVPHHLHEPLCVDLLSQGVHVFVEKPMATSFAACQAMMAAAERGKAMLAVGLMRRFLHVNVWTRAVLQAGLLGEIESFDIREGGVFNWPVASEAFFRRESAGGGVLMDIGAHVLDMLLWQLGSYAEIDYADDSFGGVEADALLQLRLASGAQGVVELSRTRNLRNTAIFQGSRGRLEISLHQNTIFAMPDHLRKHRVGALIGSRLPEQRFEEMFHLELQDWIEAMLEVEPSAVSGEEAARSIRLIESCYAKRRPLDLPWVQVTAPRELVVGRERRAC